MTTHWISYKKKPNEYGLIFTAWFCTCGRRHGWYWQSGQAIREAEEHVGEGEEE